MIQILLISDDSAGEKKKRQHHRRHLQLFSDLGVLRQWNHGIKSWKHGPCCCVVTDPRQPLAASQRAGQKWLYCWMARPQICATKQAKSLRTQSHRFLFDCLQKGWSIDWMGLLFRSRVLCVTFYRMLMLYDHCCSHQHSVRPKWENMRKPSRNPYSNKISPNKIALRNISSLDPSSLITYVMHLLLMSFPCCHTKGFSHPPKKKPGRFTLAHETGAPAKQNSRPRAPAKLDCGTVPRTCKQLEAAWWTPRAWW